MNTKDILYELRTKKGLSQDELAEKVFVTRQAVSRWEKGETVPNTETLKLLSEYFGVSINTLLGSPRQLVCQCCGMHMVNENYTEEQARAYMKQKLPTLDYWKRFDELNDEGQFDEFKQQLMDEINDLHIEGMPKLDKLNALVGKYVNLEYRLPSGAHVKFLDDQTTYLGNQLESELGDSRCFGVLANMDFILICTYEAEGANPELGFLLCR